MEKMVEKLRKEANRYEARVERRKAELESMMARDEIDSYYWDAIARIALELSQLKAKAEAYEDAADRIEWSMED